MYTQQSVLFFYTSQPCTCEWLINNTCLTLVKRYTTCPVFYQNKYVQHIVISKLILFKKLSLQLISYGVNSHLESKSQDGYSERAANCTWTFVHTQKGIHVCRYLHCRGHLRREKILDDHQTSSKVNTYIMTNHWVTITPRWTSTRIDRRWH